MQEQNGGTSAADLAQAEADAKVKAEAEAKAKEEAEEKAKEEADAKAKAEADKTKKAALVEAAVLVDCRLGKVHDVVKLSKADAQAARAEGLVELHPAGIAAAREAKG